MLGRFGLHLVPLNEGLGQYFGTTAGVLVVNVAEGRPPGLESGEVIVSIAARLADTPDRVTRILGSYGDDENVPIRLRRDARDIEVMGTLGG